MSQKYTAHTVLNYSPRKSRLLIDSIRGKKLDQAIVSLKFVNKGKAKKVHDLLKSAASNLGLTDSDYANYFIETIIAEEAQKLYRMVPRARGSAFRIRRRYSRIKVLLTPSFDKK